MSKERFQNIRACLRFNEEAGEDEERVDTGRTTRPFIEAFNLNRSNQITAGRSLTEDEIMSFWLGADRQHTAREVPHLTKTMARKQRGVAEELRAIYILYWKYALILRLPLVQMLVSLLLAGKINNN